ncbi:hypothetical protein NA56DRAFT_700877 [Hyaloscypha hepaticicola]|uniref:Uncharacterized protein n=1 Tax=Hyaloscypha hepaticicola TaxID=2082293 RepID=A0A2J6QDN8_9HELO|nr:hypothetical protein NA56DRAFT_700877 [Hyaloscypha hepaticicola]
MDPIYSAGCNVGNGGNVGIKLREDWKMEGPIFRLCSKIEVLSGIRKPHRKALAQIDPAEVSTTAKAAIAQITPQMLPQTQTCIWMYHRNFLQIVTLKGDPFCRPLETRKHAKVDLRPYNIYLGTGPKTKEQRSLEQGIYLAVFSTRLERISLPELFRRQTLSPVLEPDTNILIQCQIPLLKTPLEVPSTGKRIHTSTTAYRHRGNDLCTRAERQKLNQRTCFKTYSPSSPLTVDVVQHHFITNPTSQARPAAKAPPSPKIARCDCSVPAAASPTCSSLHCKAARLHCTSPLSQALPKPKSYHTSPPILHKPIITNPLLHASHSPIDRSRFKRV